MQPLQGVTLPEAHQFLTLRPSVTARVDRQQPAGGILALIGAVFVVLIILDYVGVTKVFRHR